MRSRTLFALGAGVPFALYVLTSSAHAYWFDSGEFTAAGVDLGVSHPPGHPLAALLIRLVAMFPVGSLEFRAALASGLLLACAAGGMALASRRLLGIAGIEDRWTTGFVGLAGGWTTGTVYGVWFQGVRPEVYGLESALIVLFVERVLASIEHPADLRPLLQASLALGLGLANHHLLTALVVPGALVFFVRGLRTQGLRFLLGSMGFGLAGLSSYLYLPLRAFAGASPNLGDPQTLDRFWWVVSAQVFQKNVGSYAPKGTTERFADVIGVFLDDVPMAALLLGAVGIWIGLRLARTRGALLFVLALLILPVFVRASIGFVNWNPDARGYLFGSYVALGLLATLALGTLVPLLGRRRVPRGLALLSAVASLLPISSTWTRTSLADFAATDAFDDDLRRNLPPRAVVILYGPQTVFRAWGGDATEKLRPDITVVPMPFLGYPGTAERLRRDAPELRDLLLNYLYENRLLEADLQGLSAARPVFLELDVQVDPSLYETIVPNGVLYEVLSESAYIGDRRVGSLVHDEWVARLDRLLAPGPRDEATDEQLLWKNYLDALYFGGVGDRARAARATERGLLINNRSRELLALSKALRSGSGALDVRQFFPQ